MNFMRPYKTPTNRRKSIVKSKADYFNRDDNIYGEQLKEKRALRRELKRQVTVNLFPPRLNIENISPNINTEIFDIKNNVIKEKNNVNKKKNIVFKEIPNVIEEKNTIIEEKNNVFKKPPKVIEEKNKITDISNNVNDISGN